jgi:hypothetical protein
MIESTNPLKTPASIGRQKLVAASFKQDVNAGSQGELWVNRFGYPALVSYYGYGDTNYFATLSLEAALTVKDERPS